MSTTDASAADGLNPTTKLAYADQCRAVSLSAHGRQLVDAAVDLHLVGNDGSDERWETDQDYRERAEMGYRAEVAVAEHYGLTPTIDYRPPKVGDAGHDYRLEIDGETLTVDVKATRTVPPQLYLTKKRAEHDRYTVPDAYLLCSTALSDGPETHLVGWVRSEDLMQRGEETEVYGNPVWRLDGLDLNRPPRPSTVEPLPAVERELWSAADRSGIDADSGAIEQCKELMLNE